MITKLAVEFTNGVRKELPLVSNALLFLKGGTEPQPILLGDAAVTRLTQSTVGTLKVGKRYRVASFKAGDNFTNVGGANANGAIFVATGTTPKVWANASVLTEVPDLAEALSTPLHTTTNHGEARLPNGLFFGQRVFLSCAGIGGAGNKVVVSALNDNIIGGNDGETAQSSLTFDAADEYALLEWMPDGWHVIIATATQTGK